MNMQSKICLLNGQMWTGGGGPGAAAAFAGRNHIIDDIYSHIICSYIIFNPFIYPTAEVNRSLFDLYSIT